MSIRTSIESFARDRATTVALIFGLIALYAGEIGDVYQIIRLGMLCVTLLVALRETNKHREATGNYPKMQDLAREMESNLAAETQRMREQADRLELERLKAELGEERDG